MSEAREKDRGGDVVDRPAATARWRGFKWIFLAPVFAFLALTAWAFASPVGAGPDDDYHLVSTWCALGGNDVCLPGPDSAQRNLPIVFREVTCFVQVEERSAACQDDPGLEFTDVRFDTKRGNFAGEYPQVYYSTMRMFAGDDMETSALTMRVFNAFLFVALATALSALLPAHRRNTLLWGWLVTLVPLGLFLIPSNNPSGWAITGVGTAFLALLGWFDTDGRRQWALGAMYLLGVVMAAGSRGDAAVYAAGATVVAMILTASKNRAWLVKAALPALGLIVVLGLFMTSAQAGVGADGFSGGGLEGETGPGVIDKPLAGMALAAFNLLQLPFLWTGVFGTWPLGWFDTTLPAIVPWSAGAAFIVVAFAGLGRLDWRKAIASAGVLAVLTAIPVYVLTVGGDRVGTQLQPRYLLPLIVLFSLVLATVPRGRASFTFTRVQTFAITGALALANLVSLQVNIRRYVTGADQQGPNLDDGAEWWWDGAILGPTGVWVLGSLAFAGLLAVLWPELRRGAQNLG